jgi:hypothetical protein
MCVNTIMHRSDTDVVFDRNINAIRANEEMCVIMQTRRRLEFSRIHPWCGNRKIENAAKHAERERPPKNVFNFSVRFTVRVFVFFTHGQSLIRLTNKLKFEKNYVSFGAV